MCHGTLVKTLCDHCNSFIAGLHSRLRCQDSARVEVSRCLHGVSFCIQTLSGRGVFRLHPNQLNLSQFLEAGPQASECPYPHPGDAKVQSGWRPLCKRGVKARISRMLVGMISQIHCFNSSSLDFSQLYFRTPPVLKINCLFNFSLQAHSFLLICFTQVFFFVSLLLFLCVYFHEWNVRKLGEKCFKYLNLEEEFYPLQNF